MVIMDYCVKGCIDEKEVVLKSDNGPVNPHSLQSWTQKCDGQSKIDV